MCRAILISVFTLAMMSLGFAAKPASKSSQQSQTFIDGEVSTNNDWDITNIAGYAVYRKGIVGFKAKTGLTYWDTDNVRDMSLSLGIGAGFKIGESDMLDVEDTKIDDFVDYNSVGYVFNL